MGYRGGGGGGEGGRRGVQGLLLQDEVTRQFHFYQYNDGVIVLSQHQIDGCVHEECYTCDKMVAILYFRLFNHNNLNPIGLRAQSYLLEFTAVILHLYGSLLITAIYNIA